MTLVGRIARLSAAVTIGLCLLVPARAFAAGPPFPEPVAGQRVYDTAELWSGEAKAEADRIIRGIEDRTNAQVVVYSQWRDATDIDAFRQDPRMKFYFQRFGALAKHEAFSCDVSYSLHA